MAVPAFGSPGCRHDGLRTHDLGTLEFVTAFPSVDLTDFDLAPTARAVQRTGESLAATAGELAKGATYTAIGLGLLTYQRLQVRRREVERARSN